MKSIVGHSFTKMNLTVYVSLFEKHMKLLLLNMNDNQKFSPTILIPKFSLNVIIEILISKEIPYSDREDSVLTQLINPVKELSDSLSIDISDYISIFKPFFYFKRLKYKNTAKHVFNLMNEIYMDHFETLDYKKPRDVMDELIIETEGDQKSVIHVCLDIFAAGVDTSAHFIEFLLLYLTNHPEYQEKIYQEIMTIVNDNKSLDFIFYKDCDINKLEFLDACIKETLRLRPIVFLGLPRVATEDTMIKDIFVPKGTQIIGNVFGILNSESYIKSPSIFKPERWIEYYRAKKQNPNVFENSLYNNLDKISVHFGIGNRSCLGKNLTVIQAIVCITNILYKYKLEPFDGKLIDDTEQWSVVIKPKHYNLKLIKR
ncbi:hypothetical protein DICPUDRAFT_80286 [Dictyostelium purpureum]|uniref:Cytochrome P450 family protein n=1 Tax=Dictyostelium purpureum TaxID=5786 RepID=F0ZQ20_DICPU|nr:uncharacterized protein DICPUDRAFT_80286 [Dictyostelium purpureum]EGC33973.1 hypothetical protein DICPUDRAFT_80286 [Dictyostelium purpureum]|eukprot:XP_003289506.1 hypothetical protein DICPUDRAFT_80286 [Dictyostelium purpureum]